MQRRKLIALYGEIIYDTLSPFLYSAYHIPPIRTAKIFSSDNDNNPVMIFTLCFTNPQLIQESCTRLHQIIPPSIQINFQYSDTNDPDTKRDSSAIIITLLQNFTPKDVDLLKTLMAIYKPETH